MPLLVEMVREDYHSLTRDCPGSFRSGDELECVNDPAPIGRSRTRPMRTRRAQRHTWRALDPVWERVWVGLLVSTPEEVKEPAELSVGVALAGGELDLEDEVLRVGGWAVGSPAIGEQPNAVPGARIDAPGGEHR